MQLRTRLKDSIYTTGLVLILIALVCYGSVSLQPYHNTGLNPFFINFGLVVFYMLVLLFSRRLKKGRDGLSPLFLFLILFFISAWALNLEMHLFEKSTPWLTVLLVVSCINYLPFACWDSIPNWLKHFHLFMAGIAIIAFTYLSLYLVPLYGLSIMASFVLGISLHTFVPLLFVVYTLRLVRNTTTRGSSLRTCWWAGAGCAIIVIVVFAVQWYLTVNKINNVCKQA